jgi:hypothetical protein
MRVNPIYRSLLDKSVSSMLSAIEIYNKPDFAYREETFAILSVNAWELLLKAKLLRENNYKLSGIYIMEPVRTKNGTPHKTRKKPKTNRSTNPVTCGLFEVIARLDYLGLRLPLNLIGSIESLVELRDNAIHFRNEKFVARQIQEIGFACIKNYIHIIREWAIEIDLTKYNLYLMPLAYVDAKMYPAGIMTDEINNYLHFVKQRIDNRDTEDKDFDIAISIDVNFKRGDSFESLPFKYAADGVAVTLIEEDIRKKFPLTHKDVCDTAKTRYSDFSQNERFRALMREVKLDSKLFHERKLDPSSEKSQKKPYYSTNIWKFLDCHFNKK